jgi:hypothetical protein
MKKIITCLMMVLGIAHAAEGYAQLFLVIPPATPGPTLNLSTVAYPGYGIGIGPVGFTINVPDPIDLKLIEIQSGYCEQLTNIPLQDIGTIPASAFISPTGGGFKIELSNCNRPGSQLQVWSDQGLSLDASLSREDRQELIKEHLRIKTIGTCFDIVVGSSTNRTIYLESPTTATHSSSGSADQIWDISKKWVYYIRATLAGILDDGATCDLRIEDLGCLGPPPCNTSRHSNPDLKPLMKGRFSQDLDANNLDVAVFQAEFQGDSAFVFQARAAFPGQLIWYRYLDPDDPATYTVMDSASFTPNQLISLDLDQVEECRSYRMVIASPLCETGGVNMGVMGKSN